MEIPLFFWLMCGVISGFVASNKGRNGCGWAVLGVALGPIGLIWALVLPANTEQLETQAIASGEFKQCRYCAEVIRSEAIKCRYCGTDLKSDPESGLSSGPDSTDSD